ncbi:potassium transporter [Candidatus Izimaplasma bacterium ZiA1]|uniref:cation:proton antiporter n=1 Tax=Candidatus Izimoplasma sp. ZiA1 TaxID=2024899 RepID=UPI000BAA5C5F|nr:potassium transporter [Candidatus Izimaplasma bacterium ZiA1]
MLFSLALIFIIGLILGEIFKKINLPSFLGMIITGILLGPYAFNLIDGQILNISKDLREIALIVILLRAGLSLDITDLKAIGKPAILMSFIPATLEIIAVAFLAPILFGIPLIEALILGSVLAAVSPAVIVPKMIQLMETSYGTKKRIPHLVMAGASVDDIYVIVLFTSFLGIYQTGDINLVSFLQVPIAIILGAILGFVTGYILSVFFAKFRVRDTIKVLIIMAFSFLIITLQNLLDGVIPISGLLAVMVLGISFLNKAEIRAKRLRNKFSSIWVFAELVLFVLVGAAVDVSVIFNLGLLALVMLIFELLARFLGVQASLLNTKFNKKERIFTGFAYLPKATVQAAIGAIPLALGVPSGDLILAIAVLSIVVTAPIGATIIELTHKKLLSKDDL